MKVRCKAAALAKVSPKPAATGTNIVPRLHRSRESRCHHGRMGRRCAQQPSGNTARQRACPRSPSNRTEGLDDIRAAVDAVSDQAWRAVSNSSMGKPGLDGHSNGAEQIAARARDAGMDITYEGIRLTPSEIVAAARENGAHVVGLSILSGSHLPLIEETLAEMRDAGLGDIPLVVGGIIPEDDANRLRAMGVARVYTPKDFELNRIMFDIVALADGEAVAAE